MPEATPPPCLSETKPRNAAARNALAWLPPYGVTAAPEKFDVLAFQGDCLVSKASVRLSLMASLPPLKTGRFGVILESF